MPSRMTLSPVHRSPTRGFWNTSAPFRKVKAFCAFNASSAGGSSFTSRKPASVLVPSSGSYDEVVELEGIFRHLYRYDRSAKTLSNSQRTHNPLKRVQRIPL